MDITKQYDCTSWMVRMFGPEHLRLHKRVKLQHDRVCPLTYPQHHISLSRANILAIFYAHLFNQLNSTQLIRDTETINPVTTLVAHDGSQSTYAPPFAAADCYARNAAGSVLTHPQRLAPSHRKISHHPLKPLITANASTSAGASMTLKSRTTAHASASSA